MASANAILASLRSRKICAPPTDAWTLINDQQSKSWMKQGADDPRKVVLLRLALLRQRLRQAQRDRHI